MGNVVVRGGLVERFARQDPLVLTLTSGILNVYKYEIRIKVSSYHVYTSDVRLCLKLDSISSNPTTEGLNLAQTIKDIRAKYFAILCLGASE